MKTIDEMKAELEANGYEFASETSVYAVWECPDGAHFSEGGIGIPADVKKANVTEKAYAHLQERKELEALRAKVRLYESFILNQYHDKAINITADETGHEYTFTPSGKEQQIDPRIKSVRTADESEHDE